MKWITMVKWGVLVLMLVSVVLLFTGCPDMDEALPHYELM